MGSGGVGHGGTRLLQHAVVERRAGLVDHVVHHDRGDDLAPQAVLGHEVAEALLQRRREVRHQLGQEVRVLGQLAGQHLGDVRGLGVGQQHGELRRREPGARGLPLAQELLGREELEVAVDEALVLEAAEVARVHVDHRRGLGPGDGQRGVLGVVVPQHELGDVVGHIGQQLVALLHREVAGGHHGVEQDLDVHLVVGAVDAGGVVDGVGVDHPAIAGRTPPGRAG